MSITLCKDDPSRYVPSGRYTVAYVVLLKIKPITLLLL